MPDPTESRITRLLGDRYELIELLGKGGFAGVYRVRNLRLQRTEALKVLSETLTEDADFARRFEQEARVAAALDHPNIVKIYDYGAIEDFFWFSMQYIGGASVGRELKARGHFDDATTARIGIGILDALAYSHARGVIHRDIKPDNILLDHEGRPYLTDFGVAKSQIALVKTHAGTLLGSPAYMSPEQLQGKPLDGRSDLYSLGVTLYRMLCGGLPFTGDDTFRATMKRLTEKPELLLSRRADIHPILADIVMRALERDPAERLPDALSMREALEDFVTDVTPPRTTRSSTATRRGAEPTPTSAPTPMADGGADEPTIPSGSLGALAPTPKAPPPTPIPPPPSSPPSPGSRSVAPPVTRASRARVGWIAGALALAAVAAAIVIALARQTGSHGHAPAATEPTRTSSPAAVAIAAASPTAAPTLAPTPSPSPSPEPSASAQPTRRPTHAARAARPTARPATRIPSRPATAVPTRAPTAAPTSVPGAGKRSPPGILEPVPLSLAASVGAAYRNETIGMVAVIGADGKLLNARVIKPVCPECDRAALDAVRRYRFRPGTDVKGNPIESSFGFTIRIP